MPLFKLHTPFEPAGSQPEAIKKLVAGRPGKSTLLGVTGSGKTYTIANVIAQQDKPVLVLAPNKTLAAQLYEEFCQFFPENKVCYFVSYYDYYQPESYIPAQDIYIPKETKINSEIERLRVESSASLINRKDTIVIASVSCIYSLGNPNDYRQLALSLSVGQEITRAELLRQLIFIQYTRNDVETASGRFQVLGNMIEVNLPYQKEKLRIELFGNMIESLSWVGKQNNEVIKELDNTVIFPARHFVTTQDMKDVAIKSIQAELDAWVPQVANPLYKERIRQRVSHDIEMIRFTERKEHRNLTRVLFLLVYALQSSFFISSRSFVSLSTVSLSFVTSSFVSSSVLIRSSSLSSFVSLNSVSFSSSFFSSSSFSSSCFISS